MSAKNAVFLLCSSIFSVIIVVQAANLQNFAQSNNYFTASVYKEIRKSYNENFIVSPFSVNLLLSLVETGAKEATSQEILQTLRQPSHSRLYENLAQLGNVRNAIKIYIKDSFTPKPNFLQLAKNVYKSEAETIDFLRPTEAASTINNWVRKQTDGKIKDLVEPMTLDSRTRAILVNALYFQANWSNPFEGFLTKKLDFYHTSGPIPVDTMRVYNTEFKFYEDAELDAKFLEMPCESEEASMVIVLPNNVSGMERLEANIGTILRKQQFTVESVNVNLPKFKIENKLDFKTVLEELGIKSMFQADSADLSGIAGKKGDLVIDKVIQKSYVDVNEEGVEAAAASYVDAIIPLSGHFPMKPSKEFIADHPFIFYIKVSEVVIFIGRVVRPQ